MSKSNAFETDFLELIFNATAIADLAEDDTTSPATSLYVSLHTSDPGEAGDQTTNETSYTNYARVAVARTSGGWTVSGNQVSNTAAVSFPTCGATGASGAAGDRFAAGACCPSRERSGHGLCDGGARVAAADRGCAADRAAG